MDQKDRKQFFAAMAMAGHMGFHMAGNAGVGLLLGRWLDKQLGWYPWCSAAGVALGLVSALWIICKRVMEKDE